MGVVMCDVFRLWCRLSWPMPRWETELYRRIREEYR